MSTNKKKLKRIVDSESTINFEEEFKSKFFFDSEEQSLKAIIKKYENSPLLFNSAFDKCINICIVWIYDYERKSNFNFLYHLFYRFSSIILSDA